ncbi:MAG TPA: hypothetical protein VNB64_08125 [Solirubrobacteraceae bacterium]|nr:hypothetical protein [Solirubrobacteraceae bacterium]
MVVLTALCLAPLAAPLFSRRVDLMSPITLVGAAFLALYALRGWALESSHVAGRDISFRAAAAYDLYIAQTLDLAICGILGFYLGYVWRIGRDVAHTVPRPRPPVRRQRWLSAGLMLTAVGLPCFVLAPYAAWGGLAGTGLTEPVQTGAVGAQLGFVYLVFARQDAPPRLRALILWLLAISGMAMLTAGLVFVQKAPILWAILTIAAAYHYGRRPLRPGQIAIAAVVFLFVAFPAVQALRHERDRPGQASLASSLATVPKALVTAETGRVVRPDQYFTYVARLFTRRLSSVDSLLVARALTPGAYPFLNGDTYTRLPETFIPRALWPEKPGVSLGDWFAVTYWGRTGAHDTSSQSVTFIGELYLNFGAGAVFVGMFLFGVMYRFWYEYLARAWTPPAIGMYAISLPTLLQVEADSVLLFRTGVGRVLVGAALLTIVGFVLSTKTNVSRENRRVTSA